MKSIGDIIKTGEYKNSKPPRTFNADCPPEKFSEYFVKAATGCLYLPGEPFVVDDENKEIINQLYLYLTQSDEFEGDLRKGILIIGALGCGKTVLMRAFICVFEATVTDSTETSNYFTRVNITPISSRDIRKHPNDGSGYLHKRPLYVDDIGKEPTTVNTFGTVTKPFEDLVEIRYRREALTFGTSNLTLDDMPYNPHTIDRMRQMFNIIVLPGKSRRT